MPTRRPPSTLANNSDFGLGCSLWTTDLDCAEALSVDIEAGTVFVNPMTASDPRIPSVAPRVWL